MTDSTASTQTHIDPTRRDAGAVARTKAAVLCDDRADVAHFWLLCRTGPHHFALPMAQVVETTRMLPIEPLAGSSPLVLGLCMIRGAPVPVLDSGRLFEDKPSPCQRLITIRTDGRVIALAAEAVLGMQSFTPDTLAELPPLLADVEKIAAIATRDEALIFFLRTARLVPDDLAAADVAKGAQA